MNGEQLRALLVDALPRLEAAREELRDLDAAIGDGDLGITVAGGAAAAAAALRDLAPDPSPTEVLKVCAKSLAAANPSTFSALVAGALLAGAKELADTTDLDRPAVVRLLQAGTSRIQERGKAQLGDKTILDAMIPSLATLVQSRTDRSNTLRDMISAAQGGVEDTTGLPSQRGRAAWVGERSVGHPDGGATAYLRLLQALAASTPSIPGL